MEEVAKGTMSLKEGQSSLDPHLTSVTSSLEALSGRVGTLIAYLEATKRGDVAHDHRLLRQVAAICQQLPVVDRETLAAATTDDYNDSLMVSYLATVTDTTGRISDLSEKFQQMTPSSSRSHRL